MDEQFRKARFIVQVAKSQLWDRLKKDPNISGAAFGRRVIGKGKPEGPALVIYVKKKLSLEVIPPSLRLPRKVYVGNDVVEVDVIETGPIFPLAFDQRERPAPSGISVGHVSVTAGTLGCLVTDNTDGSLCILSNNHVLANGNAASIGDTIIQPGDADGGSSPGDDIATLKRFVAVDCAASNRVDAAIGQVINRADVVAQFKNNAMPYPTADHPAVGLLFAGGQGRTILNPINDVLSLLNVSLLAGGNATRRAEIGMAVEKVGRTTEYTTGQVMEIDVTTPVGPYDCGNATFDGQIATCTMACPGDSGSVVCAGGEGTCSEMDCGCGTSTAAAEILGLKELGLDRIAASEFRDRYLGRTLVGRYALDVYFRNESSIVNRARQATRGDEGAQSLEFARYLYKKHADDVRTALLQPDRSELRLTSEHVNDLDQAIGRARPHMSKEESAAADEVLELARTAVGKNVREILEMLDDKGLHERVVGIVERVPSLKRPDCGCS